MYNQTKSTQTLEAEKILVEVFRITKLTNSASMSKMTNEDFEYLARNLADDYLEYDFQSGLKILHTAVDEYYKRTQINSSTDLGEFVRLCHSIKAAQKEEERTQKLLSPRPIGKKDATKQTIADIKDMLKTAIKPLPYNKEVRVYTHEDEELKKDMTLKKQEDIDLSTPAWGKFCYSDGPRLYEKCVAVGHIAPYESISDPELRKLYQKAWTVGLMKEEKERFMELTKK